MYTFTLKNFTGNSEYPFFIQYGHHEYSLALHTHSDFFELTVVLEGTAHHIINGERYFIKKGDVFGVTGTSQHGFTDCCDFRICNIMFLPEVMFAPFPDLKHCPGFHSLFMLEPSTNHKSRLRLSLTDFEVAERLISQMIDEYQSSRAGFASVFTAYFIQFVMFLSRCYDETIKFSDKIATFSKAVAHIEKSYTQKLLLDEVAAIAGLSVRQFQRQFKNAYLITPQEYIQSLRMQKAAMQLTETDNTVTDIASQCGYRDSNLFSRQFKKHTGMTPREYRERNTKRQSPKLS